MVTSSVMHVYIPEWSTPEYTYGRLFHVQKSSYCSFFKSHGENHRPQSVLLIDLFLLII